MESDSPTVVASFHLVHYHRLTPAPPKRLGQTEDGVRFWRPLNVGGDFQKFRTNPSRWALYRKLKPDFWRWAFFAIWEHEDALARFLERSPVARSWSDGAREALHLWLKPTRTRGRWSAMRALEGTEQQGLPKAPAAFITRLDLSIRGTLTMWLTAAPGILACVPDRDALQLAIPLVDRPYAQPMTFTIWTSLDRALASRTRTAATPRPLNAWNERPPLNRASRAPGSTRTDPSARGRVTIHGRRLPPPRSSGDAESGHLVIVWVVCSPAHRGKRGAQTARASEPRICVRTV